MGSVSRLAFRCVCECACGEISDSTTMAHTAVLCIVLTLHVFFTEGRLSGGCCGKNNGRPGPPGPPGPCPGNEASMGEVVVSAGPPGMTRCGRTRLISVDDGTVTIGAPDATTIVEGPNVFTPGLEPVFPGESTLSVQIDALTGQLRTANVTTGAGNLQCSCAGKPSPTIIDGSLQNGSMVLTPNNTGFTTIPGLTLLFDPRPGSCVPIGAPCELSPPAEEIESDAEHFFICSCSFPRGPNCCGDALCVADLRRPRREGRCVSRSAMPPICQSLTCFSEQSFSSYVEASVPLTATASALQVHSLYLCLLIVVRDRDATGTHVRPSSMQS